jgi:hypothetical protein
VQLTDFLGKEYGPGDLVIYGAMSGRSVNMVVGRVEEVYRVYYDSNRLRWTRLDDGAPEVRHKTNAVRVKVQPLRGARWKQHHGRKRYIDTRTGKGINPDAPSGKHLLRESHYVHADGTEFDYAGRKKQWDLAQLGRIRAYPFEHYGFRAKFHINYGEPGTHRWPLDESQARLTQLWWVSRTYQPWVQDVSKGPEPVTLYETDNIVKWDGELPDADVQLSVP